MQDRIDRRTFLRVAGAGAAASTVWRPGAEALAARTRAAAHGPNVLVVVLDSLAPRLRRRLREPVDQNAGDRRARRREPALHARLPRGDADRARAPLADDGAPRLPLARLASDAQPARLARLDRPQRGDDDVAEVAAPARLLDGLRDRQPVPRLLARVARLPLDAQPLRARERAGRPHPLPQNDLRAGGAALAAERDAQRALPERHAPAPRQRRRRARRARLVRRARLRLRDRHAHESDAAQALRDGGRLLRPARAMDAAAEVPRPLRRPPLRRQLARQRPVRARGLHGAGGGETAAGRLRRDRHARGRVAGPLPRPLLREQPRAGHGRGVPVGPRDHARRPRLDRQAGAGAAPGADPGAVPAARPDRPHGGADLAVLRVPPRRRADAAGDDRRADAGRR